MVTGFIAGAEAEAASLLSESDVIKRAVAQLGKMFGEAEVKARRWTRTLSRIRQLCRPYVVYIRV